MRNQGRNRRSRNHKEVDDSQLNVGREDPQAQQYARHQHSSYHEDPHRLPAAIPTRPEYDVGRDRTAMGARGMREDEWAASGNHDRYGYDPYHPSHGEHDSYGASVRRGDNGWGHASNDERYPSRGGWSHQYHTEPSTSYQDSTGWNPTPTSTAPYNMSPRYKSAVDHSYMPPNAYLSRSPNPYEERDPLGYDDSQGYYYEHWRGREPRASPPPDERMDYTQTDKRNSQSWGRGHRTSKSGGSGSGGGQKFQSDSGWSGRRKGKEWTSQGPADPPSQSYEDRSWEPAESWKSSNRQESPGQSRQQSSSGRSNSKQHKATRRGASSGKQKKDKKSEDLNLNNWTRRDTSTSSKKNHEKTPSSGSRRKHPRSPSRSRSPDSVHSHHSSYRSRSSSPVAKRRRRESSISRRSHSPDASRYSYRLTPDPVDMRGTMSPYGGHTPQRRRSPSSGSSARSRSRSASPRERRRAVHRLPTANPPTVQTSPVNTTTTGKSKKNKKNRAKNQKAANQSSRGTQEDAQSMRTDVSSMPPPSLPPPSRIELLPRQSTPDWREGNVASGSLPHSHGIPLPPKPMASLSIPASLPEKPGRTGPVKLGGFKPIGQPNPALKMFFPGDDEEVDPNTSATRGSAARNEQQAPAKSKGFVPQKQPPPHRNGLDDQASVFQRSLPPHQVPSWQSAPTSVPSVETLHAIPAPLSKPNGLHAVPQSLNDKPPAESPNPTPSWWAEDDTNKRDAGASASHFQPIPPSSQSSTPYGMASRYDSLKPTPQPSPSIPQPTAAQPSWHDVPVPRPMVSTQPSTNTTPIPIPTTPTTSTPAAPPPEPVNQDLYHIMNQVGEGTFGKVYKARNTASNIYVALKRIRMESEKDGFPVTAMREIKLLQSLKHANVVRLYEMMVSKGSVFMVFEYMDHDLTGILSQTQFKFSDAHLKSLCHQMLAGLAYLHHKGVIHRDIKGSNILLNNRGELKLADFGLARFYQKRRRTDYTNRVITLWYRPPELLFGATVYGAEVDMWSAGCIMLELFTKKPVFQGNDEIHQLHVTFKILGAPTVDRWPGLSKLPWYELIRPKEKLPNRFREYFQRWMSPAALDLAERLLSFDPEQRVTAQDALQAPYFTQEQPMAELPTGLSTLDGEWHELESKQERMKKRKKPTESTAA